MAGKRRSHTEQAWAQLPPSRVRCHGTRPNGDQCRREAEDGSVVCDQHGGAAPQVQRRAAERVMMTADAAAAAMIEMMNDKSVPYGLRLKAMQDVLDRANVVGKTMHEVAVKVDPAIALLQSLADDPDGYLPRQPEPAALEAGSIIEGEVIDHAQEAYDRYAESHQPDAEVVEISPSTFGKIGPHAMSEPTRSSTKIPRYIAEGLGIETRR